MDGENFSSNTTWAIKIISGEHTLVVMSVEDFSIFQMEHA